VAEFLPVKALARARAEPLRAIADRRVVREIERAQSIIEHQNHLLRRTLRRYSLLVEEQRRVLQNVRRPVLLGAEPPEETVAVSAVEFERLAGRLGKAEARRLRTRIFLVVLDRFWADHLATVEELREGIALQRFGAREPIHEFIRLASERFAEGWSRVAAGCRAEARAALKEDEAGGKGLRARAPSSTWTYALDDEPLPAFNLAGFAGGPAALVGAVLFLAKTLGAWASARRKKTDSELSLPALDDG
jgi:preprotein translocase subunit SecA